MRASVALLAPLFVVVPVSPHRIIQGQEVSRLGHAESNNAWSPSPTSAKHIDEPFDAALPPTLAGDEMKGHTALDTVHGVAKYVVMPGFALLVFVILAGSWLSLQRYTALIPESAWTVLFSATLGFFVRGLLSAGVITDHKYVWASATFLNLFLLPIIIFESGWALNHVNFLSQIEYITIFAVGGTMISFFFVGFVGYLLGQYGGIFVVKDLREHLAFAALISAVDPVATLSTFSKLGLDSSQPLLHTMIFGESVINDAVAIVLFHTINESWETLTLVQCVYDIATLLFGSVGFGLLASSLLIFLLRLAKLTGDSVPETLYVVASAWLVFAAAEAAGLSGIIANLVAGGLFRTYGARHLQREGMERTSEYLHISAHMMDTLVFTLCGVSTALIQSLRGVEFAISGFLLCLLGRALSTSTCAVACNGIKQFMKEPRSHYITADHQFMMWHAGLRGGIALLLALELDASWCCHKATLINATFIIICATLVLLGSTTELFLRLMGLGQAQVAETPRSHMGPAPYEHQASLLGEIRAGNTQKLKRLALGWLDSMFEFCLVGDSAKAEEKRDRGRTLVKRMKSGVLPRQATAAAIGDA